MAGGRASSGTPRPPQYLQTGDRADDIAATPRGMRLTVEPSYLDVIAFEIEATDRPKESPRQSCNLPMKLGWLSILG